MAFELFYCSLHVFYRQKFAVFFFISVHISVIIMSDKLPKGKYIAYNLKHFRANLRIISIETEDKAAGRMLTKLLKE